MRVAFQVFLHIAVCLLMLSKASDVRAQETSMIFFESPTLLATYVRTPVSYDPDEHSTLIVGLHGFGSSAQQFLGLAPPLNAAGIVFAAVSAPYSFVFEGGQVGYDWSLQHIPQREPGDLAMELSVDYIADVLAGLRARYEAERVFLLGFSQGGAFAYLSATSNHTLLDGLVVFGSGFEESWFSDGALVAANSLPVFIAHGDQDQAVSAQEAERARETLDILGYDVTYRGFSGGHTVSLEVLAEVIEWIEGH